MTGLGLAWSVGLGAPRTNRRLLHSRGGRDNFALDEFARTTPVGRVRVSDSALVHTCVRVLDERPSVAFYEALGFERRGLLRFESAYNVYLGLPGQGDQLELTVNVGRAEPYELGDGYGHIAVTVPDLDAALTRLASLGVEAEKPPYRPGGRLDLPRIAFVRDPDGYRIELIDGGAFEAPQDPPVS
jgi:lactoylglutathione lyase